jgi:hypothetical protein
MNEMTEYGQVINILKQEISEKELKIMKSISEGEVFENKLKTVLYTNKNKSEMKLQFKRQDLLHKARYEINDRQIDIRTNKDIKFEKITMYNLYNNIDILSKEIILSEIKPKDILIFVGNDDDDQHIIDIRNNLQQKGINSVVKNSCSSPEVIRLKDNIIKVSYDSSILNKLSSVFVRDYGQIYNFKNNLLKIKRKRDDIEEAVIMDEITENIANDCVKVGKESEKESFYSNDLKLLTIKKDLARSLMNEKLFIMNGCVTNHNNEFKVYLRNDNEVVLEGSFSPIYLKVRKCIYSNYISNDK